VLSAFAEGRIFGEIVGDGPPVVVCLHGWGRSHRDAIGVLDRPGLDALPGYSLDLPGFGASPPPDEPWGSSDYARALVPVIEAVGAPVVLVGHSHGGRVSVALADLRPDLVAGLVLVGAPVLRPEVSSKPSWRYRTLRTLHRLHVVSDERFEAIRRRSGSADYNAATGVMRDTLVRVINESFDVELGRVAVPVALVWGEHDVDVPLAVAERAAGMLEGGACSWVELTVVPGAGHLTVTEDPEAVRKALDDVLAEVAT
jgi:pimeloyl-ACP methyl ester carboxylesterase